MFHAISRYAHWLHTQWPAGTVEKLPEVGPDGSTNVPGLYVVGDLAGIPLLKFAADTGAGVVRTILADPTFQRSRGGEKKAVDVAIVGAGVSGMAAALEARKLGMSYALLEASEPLSTLVNFPRQKPIFTYPSDMVPAGELKFVATVKEPLLEELRAQTIDAGITPRIARVEQIVRQDDLLEVRVKEGEAILAHRVVVAIGQSGNFRRLGVPGEALGKVYNRLHDPRDFAGRAVLVVGGGDSALEAASALAEAGARATLSYRGKELSRPKPENLERVNTLATSGTLELLLGSEVLQVEENSVKLRVGGSERELPNDVVFVMIGREPPLEFFRRSGIAIRGELRARDWLAFLLFLAFCTFLYNWKAGGALTHLFEARGLFPFNVPAWLRTVSISAEDRSSLLGTLSISLSEPGFYYSVVYCLAVVLFGIQRIRLRRTPYVRVQTLTLMAVQLIPLFLLPYVVLPWLGNNGIFDQGVGLKVADALFPRVDYGFGREYWRAFGLILAWPLFIWNVFSSQPMGWWLAISFVQTFIIIPLIVYRWGKGAYCGWICSCGALAETLGDSHRQKMPHGPIWNRLNMIGQVVLGAAMLLFFARALSWSVPGSWMGQRAGELYNGLLSGWAPWGIQLNYRWIVDVTLAGIVGVGFYFWFSGRVWCRFACPLAALMHIYGRFSQFRILADKKKCISCNICTSVCHQGIDVMSFANKGLPMADPECVRCSACVQSCPTGVLTFGAIDVRTGAELRRDTLSASPVQLREKPAGGPFPV